MRKLIFILLTILEIPGFAQGQFVNIKGHVIAESHSGLDTALVTGVEIILTINDTIELMTLSDEKGYYEFNINKFKGTATLNLHITTKSKSKKPKISCLLGNRDKRIINLNRPEKVNYTVDFIIKEGICDKRMPEALFKKNSLEFESDLLYVQDKPGEAVQYVFLILRDNPTIVIELDGHCDFKEKKKCKLSLKRAELMRDLICEKGIVKERIKIKAFGDSQPIISKAQIKSAISKNEKNKLRCRNRGVFFKVLSFDYGVKESTKKEIIGKDE